MKALLTRARKWLSRQPPQVIFLIGLTYVLVLGGVNNLCTGRMTFTVYYLAGIALVGWGAGLRKALLLGCIVTVLTGVEEWAANRGTPSLWVLLWNTVARLLGFCGVAWLVAETTSLVHGLRELVEERTASWKGEMAAHQATSVRLAETANCLDELTKSVALRKDEEAELRSREERLRLGLESARMVTWDYEIASGSIRYSDNLTGFVGGDATQPYCSLEEVLLQIHPDYRDNVRRGLKRAEEPGAEFEEEYRARMVDGSYRWILAKGRAVRDPAGAATAIYGTSMDHTERKEAEGKIRFLADALQSAKELICVTDRENRFIFANRAFLEAYGYTEREILGKGPELLASPNAPPGLSEEIFRQTLAGGWTGETVNRASSGTEFPVALSTSQIKDGEGNVIGLIGVARDISEQKRAEKQRTAFSQLGHRLSVAVDAEQAAGVIMDIALELFGWDAGYIHLYSAADDRLIPVQTMDTVDGRRTLVQPTGFTLDPSPLMRLVMKEGARLINRDDRDSTAPPLVPFGDTTRRSASMMYAPILSGASVVGLLSVQSYSPQAYSPEDLRLLQALADYCGDALQRIKGREALREAEAKYRSIFENATEGIFQTTSDGRYLSANPALARMMGYASSEELASSVTDVERQLYVIPERRRELQRILESEGQVQDFESQVCRKDGGRIWVRVNAHVVRDAGGAILYYEGTIQDVTMRRQAEEALQKSQRLAKALIDNIPDPAWLKDLDGRVLACNEPFARFRARNMEEIIGKTVFDFIPEEAERRSREDQVVIQSRKPAVYEARQMMEQGRVGWFETIKSPLLGAQGEVIGTTGIARDITERKWTEALLQVQRDFGLFLSSANDLQAALERLLTVTIQNEGIDCGAVYIADERTGALDLVAHRGLPAALVRRISRLAASVAEGQRDSPLEQHEPALRGIVHQLKHAGWAAVEAVVLGHGGQTVGVLALGSRTRGEIPGRSLLAAETIAGQAGDAIARIRAERSLYTSREMLHKTLQSVHVAVFVLEGGTGMIQECNLAATRVFGYSREEMVGHSLAFLHPNAQISEHYRGYLASARKSELSEFDFPMRHKDGTVFPCAHGLTAIRNEAGRVVNWVSVVRDITRRKQTEEDLRELSRRIIEVQEAEHLRVARELHDGVNQIIASAKMRLRKVQETVAVMSPAAGEILARCDQLLVQALEENRRIAHNLHPSVLDELGLAVACRNLCKELEARSRLAVKCSLAEIPQRLPQPIELNLFRIAQEALNNVERHARASRVWLRVAFQGDSIVLGIRDDGRGFDATMSKEGRAKARGIGLKNILERVASIGGTCEVNSAPDQGTVITVRVPYGSLK